MTRPWRALAHLSERLRGRADSEHEQAAIRIGLGVLACAYMLTRDLSGEGTGAVQAMLAVAVFLMSAALALFVAIVVWPAPSPWRRCIGILVDNIATSAAMGIAGESGAPLLAIYLWVIIGNGFRFGLPYLGVATLAAFVGFGSVALGSGFWGTHPVFSASFLLVLLLIPAYAALLLQKLNLAIREANAANAAKSQFLAKMSHELRTPLNGVIGMSDLLMDSPLQPQQLAFARTIQGSAQTLLGIIENILDFSKIEAGRVGVESIDFDLHRLLSDTLRMLRPQALRKSLRLALHVDPAVPFLLRGDPLHTRQILTNLIGNAVKFTERGAVEVRATLAEAPSARGTRRLRFEIEDTGIGIDAALHGRIFESFRQADSSTTRLYGGTGLGAAIARELTMLLGGQIGFSSAPGEGSLFWVELPFALQPQEARGAAAALAGTRVLVVGALDAARRVGSLLADWGLPYRAVSSAVQASGELLRACAGGEPFDLVLAIAPDLDPVALAEGLRAEPRLDGTGLVLVDAPANPAARSDWLRIGYAAVLSAPLERTLLLNAVHLAQSNRDRADRVVSLADRYRQLADRRGDSLHILVAEDNETNRTVLQGILERVGHRVSTVNDGEAALDLLESAGHEIDLMILDMNMPKRTGLDVFRAYRFMMPVPQIPTIVLTADATPEALAACREAGVDAYLTKPVETVKLLATLARFGKARPQSAPERPGSPSHARKAAAAPEAPLLDLAKLKSLKDLGIGSSFFKDLIGGFMRDSRRSVAAIAAANEEQNYPALHDALHALRGSAGELGATRIAALCQQLRALKPFELGLPRSLQIVERLRAVEEETGRRLEALAAEGRPVEP